MAVVDAQSEPQRQPSGGRHPLVIVLVAAAAGILTDHCRPLPLAAWWTIALAALGGGCLLWRKGRDLLAGMAILLAAMALAASWHHCRWNNFGYDNLGLFARSQQQPVCIEAVALQTPREIPQPEFNPLRPRRSGDEVRFEVELRGIRDGDHWRTASGRAALLVEGLLPELAAGDRFQAFAHLLPPEHALNPGETDAAVRDRARRITSHLRVNYPEAISVLQTGSALSPWRRLEALRSGGRQIFEKHLQPRQANLAAAVLLGLREQLDPEETEAFQLTGTVHLLI